MKHTSHRSSLWLIALLGLVLVLTVGLMSACDNGFPVDGPGTTADTTAGETDPTPEDTTSAEPEDTTSAVTTEAVTENIGWTADTGVFNAGKVNYEKLEETRLIPAFSEDKVGTSMHHGQHGVDSLIHADFADGDPTVGGLAAPFRSGSAGVLDGQLILPFDGESNSMASDGWTTWYPTVAASFSDYLQTGLSLKWDIRSAPGGAWTTATIGCYLSNAPGKIPDAPGDGLWISLHENSNFITIYDPDNASWPAGWIDIPVEEDILKGTIGTTVVCTPDRTTYVYVKPAGASAERLLAKITFSGGSIQAYGEDGTLVAEKPCTTNALKGEGYSVFVHGQGGATIEEASLLGASKGTVIKNTTITATPTEGNKLGLDITDKTGLVSICYSVWFDAIIGTHDKPLDQYNNITEALAGNQPWGPVSAFHYWSKPAEGYYSSSDKNVIRKHMTQLYTAGVDYIVIDLTNANDGYIGASAWTNYIQKPMDAICDTIMEMRAEGQGTPYVVFWVGDNKGPLYREIYNKYHAVEKWQDCFVYWDDKPFLHTTHMQYDEFPCKDLFTIRSMWGLKFSNYEEGQWSFLNPDNTVHLALDKNGKAEQVSVAVASQESYMSQPTAHGREGGFFWFRQWYYAFDIQPKVVTLTWWNEWTAQRFDVKGLQGPQFVDNYNQEYSRDIEPMEGGHGDQYYQWMKAYISAYKGGKECPVLVEEKYTTEAERWAFLYKRQS